MDIVIRNIEPTDEKSILENNIRSLYSDEEGDLWIGTNSSGFCKYVSEKNEFIRVPLNIDKDSSLFNGRILSISEDDEGDLWIASEGAGLLRYHKKLNISESISEITKSPSGEIATS